MKIKLNLIFLASILTLCITSVKAQTTYSPSHLQAAERMIAASGVLEHTQQMFETAIAAQAKQVPEEKRAAFVNVMQKFFNKYITPEEINKAFTQIYVSEYSEDELNKIADFLSTPAGKAMTAKQPELMQKGMEWGQGIAQAHQQELQEMMKEAFAK